jgi:hypothetical protein
LKEIDAIGGHPDSEMMHLLTVAGQRWTYTILSPFPLVAVPHQNRLSIKTLPHIPLFWKRENIYARMHIDAQAGFYVVVTMSGLATNKVAIKARKEGIQSFLAKPFTAPELLNLLPDLCGRN